MTNFFDFFFHLFILFLWRIGGPVKRDGRDSRRAHDVALTNGHVVTPSGDHTVSAKD